MRIFIFLIPFFYMQFTRSPKNFYDFEVLDIDGKEISLSQYKGRKVLVVNVASKCGLTPQYEKLQMLYDEYGGENFEIIGFPANNFGGQEPGTNEEIKAFCTNNYNVSFTMMSKISVKGNDQHPLYVWLSEMEENGVLDAPVTWNFQKYLIDENGQLLAFFSPDVGPLSEEIIKWLE